MKNTMSKRVIITAAGSGIGRAIAECFQAQGDHVFICDILNTAVTETIAANHNIDGVVADVGRPEEMEYFIKTAVKKMGGVDVLINNAGIGGPRALVEDITYEEWDATIRINLSGMFYCIKQVTPLMKAQRNGCIINISTGSTRTGLPNRLPYVVSKEGVNGMTRTLARELGPFNIRCNAILPGTVQGKRGDKIIADVAQDKGISPQQAKADSLRYISLRTDIAPSEIGDMACFLASEKAKHVSGQLIGVCGNMEWEE